MVLTLLLHLAITGVSVISDKELREDNISNFRLKKKEIDLIDEIEKIEIDLIKKGMNPERLTLKEVYKFLDSKEKNHNPHNRRYKLLLNKIEEYLQNSK